MVQAIPVTGKAKLTVDGSYVGTADRSEQVQLMTRTGMTVSLHDIESVRGSAGNDTVTLNSGSLFPTARIDLGRGQDTLHITGDREYFLGDLKGVEMVTGDAGAVLNVGKATFATDGSISITSSFEKGSSQQVTFTDLKENISVALGAGKDTVTFGTGFDFDVDAGGRLIAMHDGKTLTFEGVAPTSKLLTIVIEGQKHIYADLVADILDARPPQVVSVEASSELLNDASAGTTLSVAVTFSKAMLADGSANPVLTFDPDLTGTLAFTGGSWNQAHTVYTATYAVSDVGADVDYISVDVGNAADPNGLAQLAYEPEVEFAVDMAAPTVGSTNCFQMGLTDANNPLVSVVIFFSESVESFTADALSITGGTMTAGPNVEGTAAQFFVEVPSGSTDDLQITLDNTVADAHGNALAPITLTVPVELTGLAPGI